MEKTSICGIWKYEDFAGCGYTFLPDGNGSYTFCGAAQPFQYWDEGDTVKIQYPNSFAPNIFRYRIEQDLLLIEDSFGNEVQYRKADCI